MVEAVVVAQGQMGAEATKEIQKCQQRGRGDVPPAACLFFLPSSLLLSPASDLMQQMHSL